MMEQVFSRISQYGREMTLVDDAGEERPCRGFLQPVNTLDYDGVALFQAPGMASKAAYLLLVPPEAVRPGQKVETLLCGGETYEVLALQGIFCGESLTHWEGAARRKGGGI